MYLLVSTVGPAGLAGMESSNREVSAGPAAAGAPTGSMGESGRAGISTASTGSGMFAGSGTSAG